MADAKARKAEKAKEKADKKAAKLAKLNAKMAKVEQEEPESTPAPEENPESDRRLSHGNPAYTRLGPGGNIPGRPRQYKAWRKAREVAPHRQ